MKGVILGALAVLLPLITVAIIYATVFDGSPTSPQNFNQHPDYSKFAVTTLQSDPAQHVTHQAWNAAHGSACQGPDAVHPITTWNQNVFICSQHVMSSMHVGGYGLVSLTKAELLDWSAGPAVFTFDMDTRKGNSRDWFDLTVVPFEHMVGFWDTRCGNDGVLAKKGFEIIDNGSPGMNLTRFDGDGCPTLVATGPAFFGGVSLPLDGPPPNQASVRQPFKLTVTTGHVRFERLASSTGTAIVFFDADVAMDYTSGMVSWAEHTYDSLVGADFRGTKGVGNPASWHLDEFAFSCNGGACPQMTLIKSPTQRIGSGITNVCFDAAAPSDAFLQWSGLTSFARISYNNGATWLTYDGNLSSPSPLMNSYLVPIPQGQQCVLFDVGWFYGPSTTRDFHIWKKGGVTSTPTPTASSTPVPATSTSTPSPIPPSTSTPSFTPTSTSTPTTAPSATPSITPTPTAIPPTSTPVPPTSTPTSTPAPVCREAYYLDNVLTMGPVRACP